MTTLTAEQVADRAHAFVIRDSEGRLATRPGSKLRSQPDDVRGSVALGFQGKRVRVTLSGPIRPVNGVVVTVARLWQHSYPFVIVVDPGRGAWPKALSTAAIESIEEQR